jgi:tetratricopeptide (TPR) repeat protein
MTRAIGAALVWLASVLPAVAAPDQVLVIPFENVTRESRIFWLSEASAVILADDLNALGAQAFAREERRAAFERLQLPPAATLTDATVIRIGELVGASQVVVGTLSLDNEQLVVRARAIALAAGRIEHDVTERGPVADLFSIFERLARRIGPSSAGASAQVQIPHAPVGAFENYIKGLIANSPATSITYLNAALQLAPDLTRARLALWESYSAQGQHDRALAALKGIPADSPWSNRGRFRAGLSQIQLSRYDDAFATFRALADEHPDARVLNNLGVVQLRRGRGATQGVPTYFFNKAVEADPAEADYFFNLGYAYWLDRDPGAAMYWLREAVRRNAADGDAHFVLGAALAATGNQPQAARERELARRLSSTYEQWEKRPADEVLKGLERLKTDVELPRAEPDDAVTNDVQRDQRELARFYLDRGRRFYLEERDTEALSELNRTLFLAPYEAEAHLLVGRIYLRGGRTHEAIDALKISIWSADTSDAHLALADAYFQTREMAAAHDEAQRALALDPSSKQAQALLEKTVP